METFNPLREHTPDEGKPELVYHRPLSVRDLLLFLAMGEHLAAEPAVTEKDGLLMDDAKLARILTGFAGPEYDAASGKQTEGGPIRQKLRRAASSPEERERLNKQLHLLLVTFEFQAQDWKFVEEELNNGHPLRLVGDEEGEPE